MRTKTVQIQSCGDCPHRYYDDVIEVPCCHLTDRSDDEVSENGEIPEWCPLEETTPNQQPCAILKSEELKTIVPLIVEGIISQLKAEGFKERRPHQRKEK